jgi:hypothetical protein
MLTQQIATWIQKLHMSDWSVDPIFLNNFIYDRHEEFYESLADATEEYYIRDYASDELGGEIPKLDFDIFEIPLWNGTPYRIMWDHLRILLFNYYLEENFFDFTTDGEITYQSDVDFFEEIVNDYDLHIKYTHDIEKIWRMLFYSFQNENNFYNLPVRRVW